MMMELVCVTPGNWAPMPDAKGLEVSPVFSDVGVVKFNYPKAGLNSQYIAEGNEFAIMIDGVEVPDLRFIMEESNIDEAAEEQEWQVQSSTLLAGLGYALVYPPNWPTVMPLETQFVGATPGTIMRQFLLAAQSRSSLTGYTFASWGTSTDSSGAAWTKNVTLSYDPGVSLLSVLQDLVTKNAVEVRMVGRDIRLYNPGTLGTDLTVSQPGLILRRGRDMKDSPRKTSRKELATVMLVQGEPGYFSERTDAPAISLYGRREAYANTSGITDTGTLAAYGDAVLGMRKQPRVEKTHGLLFAEQGGPEPFNNFSLGDWIYSDTNGTVERLRIKQWTLKNEDDGVMSGSVVLNDLFADTVEKLLKTVDGITGAAVGSASTTGTATDVTKPAVPATPSFSSSVYLDANGNAWSQITVSWTAITANTDGSTILDFDRYVVQYGWGSTPTSWTDIYNGQDLICYYSPIKTGTQISVRVGAYDKNGNFSGWSPSYTATTASDGTAPVAPSTPTITSKLGILELTWDGKDNVGAAQPSDYEYTEIHMSTTTGFTPSATTLMGTLVGAGTKQFVGLTYNTPYYFKLVSIDSSLNRSAASAQATGTPIPLVRTDIGANSITYNEIAYKDDDNLIPDGSFEDATIQSIRQAAATGTTQFTYPTASPAPFHGTYALQCAGNATTPKRYAFMGSTTFDVRSSVMVVPGQKVYWRIASYRGSTSVFTTSQFVFRFLLNNGTFSNVTANVHTGATNTWVQIEGTVTVPASAVAMDVYWDLVSHTAGNLLIDAFEMRRVIQTALIEDAAITNAKIGSLAVNDAKINDVTVNKVTAGTLSAAVVLGGSISTGSSPSPRVVLDSAGIKLYKDATTVMVNMDTASGNVAVTGALSTARTGGRIVIDTSNTPSGYYGTFPNTITMWNTGSETTPAQISLAAGVLKIRGMKVAAGTPSSITFSDTGGVTIDDPSGSIILNAGSDSLAVNAGVRISASGDSWWQGLSSAYMMQFTGFGETQFVVPSGTTASQIRLIHADSAVHGIILRMESTGVFYILRANNSAMGNNWTGERPLIIDNGSITLGNSSSFVDIYGGNLTMTSLAGAPGGSTWRYMYYGLPAENATYASRVFLGAVVSSSEKVKKGISLLQHGISATMFNDIDVYSFQYRTAEPDRNRLGFIAERIIEAGYSDLVDLDPDGEPVDVDTRGLLAILWNEVKDLRNRVKELEV